MYINQCPSLSYEDKKAIKDPRKSDLEGQSSTGQPCRLLPPTPSSRSSLHQRKRMVRRLCALAEMLWVGRRGAPEQALITGHTNWCLRTFTTCSLGIQKAQTLPSRQQEI